MAATPEPASVALRVTVCLVWRQPVVALVCRPVAVVVGAVVSAMPPLVVVRIVPAAPTTTPRPGLTNATAARSAAEPVAWAAHVAPPFTDRRTLPAAPEAHTYVVSP